MTNWHDRTNRHVRVDPVRLGMLTPSSNTVLEPMVTAMLAGLDDVTVHFSRFPVTRISLDEDDLRQFDYRPIVEAAGLLADARVDAIVWNGTSAGWLGFDTDTELCARIADATGIATGTSVLALNEVFLRTGVRRFGLVTPYVADVQDRIVRTYCAAGFDCVAERHLEDLGNYTFANYTCDTIADLVRQVAEHRPDAITVLCTNFRGAPVVNELEHAVGIPIYDSVATAVWQALRLGGVETRRVAGWGSLFTEVALRG